MHVGAVCLKILAGWFMLSVTTLVLVGALCITGTAAARMLQAQKAKKSLAILRLKNGRHERPATHTFAVCSVTAQGADSVQLTSESDWLSL